MKTSSDFMIIGAGVAGLTCAIAFESLGLDFCLFEKSAELKGIGAGFGLAANAMRALEILGLREEVEQIGYYINNYNILDQKGNVLAAPDTKSISAQYQQQNFAIHRADLHLYLLSKVKSSNYSLGKQAIRFEKTAQGEIDVFFADGTVHRAKYLILADGIKSPLRQQLLPSSTPRYAGYTCWRATIDNSTIQLNEGSETWGKAGRFGMTPLIKNRIYWYACINSSPNNPTYKNFKVTDLAEHFKNYHPLIPKILSQTNDKDLLWNDILDIRPLRHLAYDSILLIGDAGHATTPNMGQGACQALEDVAILADELKSNKNVKEAFLKFEKRRIQRTTYITNTSKLIGEVAQWENPFLISVRNMLLKNIPPKLSQKSLQKLLSTDFMKINA